MKSTLSTFLLLFLFVNLSKAQLLENTQQFTQDLESLQDYFHIPGMAAVVQKGDEVIYENYLGFANLKDEVPVTANTIFPVASLTKVFAATLIFQLEEEGKLSLEDPIKKYFPKADIPESVKVKHVLSHTSQGETGKHFFYSFRYSYLTQVIEQASGRSFSELLQEKIIQPLDMQTAALLASEQQAQGLGDQLAQPYTFQGETEAGRFEPGFSAAAGLMMTARDLLLFDEALDKNQLIRKKSKQKMFSPFYEGSPYGLGIFTQEFLGKKLVWGYGQYDCYSSLYLKVPEEDLTLVLLANNNLMSDPARLIYGDVSYSLFALSFLKNFVFGFPEREVGFSTINPYGNWSDWLNQLQDDEESTKIICQQILAWGLAKSFMGQAFEKEKKESYDFLMKGLVQLGTGRIQNNLSLMHALIMNLDTEKTFHYKDFYYEVLINTGKKLLEECPENPYANFYMAEYHASQGKEEKALSYFETIADAKNFERFWYTNEALNFIRNYYVKKGEPIPNRYKN